MSGSSIVTSDPLRFEFSDGSRVLDITISKATRGVNEFTAATECEHSNCVVIGCDFLDPGDGAVIEILHTDPNLYPTVKGTIRGIPKGMLDWGEIRQLSQKKLPSPLGRVDKRKLYYIMLLFGLGLVGFASLAPNSLIESAVTTPTISPRILIAVAGAIYALLPISLLWTRRRRFPKLLSGFDASKN